MTGYTKATLFKLIPHAEDRARIDELARRFRVARDEGVLDEVILELDRHWRAIRRTMPTREEVAAMLMEEEAE